MAIESRNPATGELMQTFEPAPPQEIEHTLARAAAAFEGWRRRRFAERATVLREAARLLRAEKAEHARTMALEMGKPVTQGEEEVEKCAWACDFFAEHGEAFMAELPRQTEAARSYVRFDPLGPVLAIIPFDDDDDAVRIANDSIYGLSGAVTSASEERALAVARRIRSGTLSVNGAMWFAVDTPFGGYRQSGVGRENGIAGFEEYLETKAIGLPVHAR